MFPISFELDGGCIHINYTHPRLWSYENLRRIKAVSQKQMEQHFQSALFHFL